jgi:hypothetical protein
MSELPEGKLGKVTEGGPHETGFGGDNQDNHEEQQCDCIG